MRSLIGTRDALWCGSDGFKERATLVVAAYIMDKSETKSVRRTEKSDVGKSWASTVSERACIAALQLSTRRVSAEVAEEVEMSG